MATANPDPPQEAPATTTAQDNNPSSATSIPAAAADPDRMDEDTPEVPPQQSQAQEREEEEEGGEGAASPPLPTRHTAVTPGPRAARLQELYASTLSRTLARVSWDNFAACYPTAAAHAPQALGRVQRQVVEGLAERCNREFEAIMTNRNVVPKLNELESLISDASRRRDEKGALAEAPVPPHLLPADQILAAHMAPHLASQQSQLNARLQNVQADNARLFDEVAAQRAEILSLLAALEGALRDVDGASDLLGGVVGDLARETREVELEIMAAPSSSSAGS